MSTDITKFHGSNLFEIARKHFSKVLDHRAGPITYPLSEVLMSGLAVFILKFPSLLKFENWYKDEEADARSNLQNIFGISDLCSDTTMREILDEVSPKSFEKLYDDFFNLARRQKKIYPYERLENNFLISIDGTQVFSSNEVNCDNCLKKLNKADNTVTSSHKALAASFVHPDDKLVLPMGCEMIEGFDTKKEGVNDCEQNAFLRYLDRLKTSHPKLKKLILADALHASVPVLERLKEHEMSFILNVKPKGHKKLFKGLEKRRETGQMISYTKTEEIGDKVKKKRVHFFEFSNGLILNSNATEHPINFVDYTETTTWITTRGEMKEKRIRFSWVTDLTLSTHNCMEVMRAGRARWKIENETFNTLKNHGYEFEHNYGHGNKHLCSVFTNLCLLGFTIDQLQRLGCKVMQRVHVKTIRFSYYVDRLRGVYRDFNDLKSWDDVLRVILGEVKFIRVVDTS